MRIRYMSDLHLEFTDYLPPTLPSVGEDLVVLAGDVGVGIKGARWASTAFGDRRVLYVAGNHEFYWNHFVDLPNQIRSALKGTNVTFLENESTVIDGVRFLGCTFWSDFELFGPDKKSRCMEAADEMTDYLQIVTGPAGLHRKIRPVETMLRHHTSREWLDREIRTSTEPCVVITHHSPSYKTCVSEFQNDFLTSAFISRADHLLRPPVKAWIFGHTHQVFKFEINGVPVLSNQRGYPAEEVHGFRWDTCFEIDTSIANAT